MNKKIQAANMMFAQPVKPEYWNWDDSQSKLFSNFYQNQPQIYQLIFNKLNSIIDEPFEIGLSLHNHDENGGVPENDHIQGYIGFKSKKYVDTVASALGIPPQQFDVKGGRYSQINAKAYLTHEKDASKYHYPMEQVETFGTFDFPLFVKQHKQEFENFRAKRHLTKTNESLEKVLDMVLNGNLNMEQIMTDKTYKLLYADNEEKFLRYMNTYGLSRGYETLKQLKNNEFEMVVLYVNGDTNIGKTFTADKIAELVVSKARENGYFDASVYSASESNSFDDYLGEDIIILDDLSFDSMKAATWKKVLDPLNRSKVQARFKNKMICARLIIQTTMSEPYNFYNQIKGEDVNQFIRRIDYKAHISEKQFKNKEHDNIYSLGKSAKLSNPQKKLISNNEYITISYGFNQVFQTDSFEKFIYEVVNNYIYPKSYGNKKESSSSTLESRDDDPIE